MACIRHRRGAWVLDYRDATGHRRWETYDTKREAEDAFAAVLPASRQTSRPTVDPNVTLTEYAERWLKLCANLKPRTVAGYREKLRLHILPSLGSLKIRRLHRAQIKDLLALKRESGLAVDSVRLIYATLRTMLTAAVEDSVIPANPAAGVLRSMRLTRSARASQERIRALDGDQLTRLLASAETRTPALFPLFFLLSRTGLRLGEALALEWGDLDLRAREMRIERAVGTDGRIDTPKSGHGRTVDLSRSVCVVLRGARTRAAREALAAGRTRGPVCLPGQGDERAGRGRAHAARHGGEGFQARPFGRGAARPFQPT